MFKKIFVATMLSSIILVATQANICGAMIAPHQMYLGGITYGSKIDELKKNHGEPDAIYNGIEEYGYATCSYGDGVLIHYKKVSGQIHGITVTENNSNWRGDKNIGVGMYFDEWLKDHAEPELVKEGDEQTVYLYFHYKSNPVLKETFRDYGLFIAFNNKSGVITEMRIEGDTDVAPFEEIYEGIMSDMLIPIEG